MQTTASAAVAMAILHMQATSIILMRAALGELHRRMLDAAAAATYLQLSVPPDTKFTKAQGL